MEPNVVWGMSHLNPIPEPATYPWGPEQNKNAGLLIQNLNQAWTPFKHGTLCDYISHMPLKPALPPLNTCLPE